MWTCENGRMIPGFIEGVIGMKVGETKTVDCQFPDDYPKEDARGRKAAFEIELKDLKTRELPELDDEFAKQASEQETLADLRKDLEQRLKGRRRTPSDQQPPRCPRRRPGGAAGGGAAGSPDPTGKPQPAGADRSPVRPAGAWM